MPQRVWTSLRTAVKQRTPPSLAPGRLMAGPAPSTRFPHEASPPAVRPAVEHYLVELGVRRRRRQRHGQVFTSAAGSEQRLARGQDVQLKPGHALTEVENSVFVDPTRKFQTVLGIGGAITDSSAEVFAKLSKDKQAEFLKAYYDPQNGIGYSLARTTIHSSDFSSASYTYIKEGDKALKTFSIDHDRQFRIPLLKQAIAAAGGQLTTFASPWSAPAFMKTTNNMLRGGSLRPEYAEAWATYFTKFIAAYEAAGIPLWGISLQNEPMAVQKWESMVYSAEEERDFLKNHLGPVMARAGYGDKKIIVWDHNRDMMAFRAQVIFDDPEAAKLRLGHGLPLV